MYVPTTLEKLDISFNTKITKNSIESVCKNLKNLKELNLFGLYRISSKDLKFLSLLSNLQKLNVGNCNSLNDEIFDFFPFSLNSLSIAFNPHITSVGIQRLFKNRKITSLDLSRCTKIDDDASFCYTKSLEFLSLHYTSISDRSLLIFNEMELDLVRLDLSFCNLSKDGVFFLSPLKSLKFLDIRGSKISQKDKEDISELFNKKVKVYL